MRKDVFYHTKCLESILKSEAEEQADYYKSYTTGRPVVKTIIGVGIDESRLGLCREKLEEARQKLGALESKASSIIEKSLLDGELKTLLMMRYVQCMSLDDIACELGYSKSAVYKKLNSLKSAQK